MLLDVSDAHRLERAVADVERHVDQADAVRRAAYPAASA